MKTSDMLKQMKMEYGDLRLSKVIDIIQRLHACMHFELNKHGRLCKHAC